MQNPTRLTMFLCWSSQTILTSFLNSSDSLTLGGNCCPETEAKTETFFMVTSFPSRRPWTIKKYAPHKFELLCISSLLITVEMHEQGLKNQIESLLPYTNWTRGHFQLGSQSRIYLLHSAIQKNLDSETCIKRMELRHQNIETCLDTHREGHQNI